MAESGEPEEPRTPGLDEQLAILARKFAAAATNVAMVMGRVHPEFEPPRRRYFYMALNRSSAGLLRIGHDGAATLDGPDGAHNPSKPPLDPLALGEVLGTSAGMAALTVQELNPGFAWVLIRETKDPLPKWLPPGEVAQLFLSLAGPWELRLNGTLIQAGLRFLPDGSVEVRP